jgi:hypothetical protein
VYLGRKRTSPQCLTGAAERVRLNDPTIALPADLPAMPTLRLIIFVGCLSTAAVDACRAAAPPNIVFILADDK